MKKIQRILALTGVLLLLSMYAACFVFAMLDGESADGWFKVSIFCTIAVPVLLYVFQLAARVFGTRGDDSLPADGDPEDTPPQDP